MSRKNLRSFSREDVFGISNVWGGSSGLGAYRAMPAGPRFRSLLQRAGRALGTNAHKSSVEKLEQRQMLEGSFASPLLLPAPDGSGVIVQAGDITPGTPSTDNDTYSFIAPANGFVTVLADTANEVSNLDSIVRVFNNSQAQIAVGANNDAVTSGPQRDGWAGFIATAGERYFVRVTSEGTAAGTYTLRVRTTNSTFDIGEDIPTETGIARAAGSPVPDATQLPPILPQAILGQLGGTGPVNSRLRQDEIVYRYDVPGGTQWSGLVTVMGTGGTEQS